MSSYYSPKIPVREPGKKKEKKIVLSIEHGDFEYQFMRNRKGENLIQDDIRDFKFTDVNILVRKVRDY